MSHEWHLICTACKWKNRAMTHCGRASDPSGHMQLWPARSVRRHWMPTQHAFWLACNNNNNSYMPRVKEKPYLPNVVSLIDLIYLCSQHVCSHVLLSGLPNMVVIWARWASPCPIIVTIFTFLMVYPWFIIFLTTQIIHYVNHFFFHHWFIIRCCSLISIIAQALMLFSATS